MPQWIWCSTGRTRTSQRRTSVHCTPCHMYVSQSSICCVKSFFIWQLNNSSLALMSCSLSSIHVSFAILLLCLFFHLYMFCLHQLLSPLLLSSSIVFIYPPTPCSGISTTRAVSSTTGTSGKSWWRWWRPQSWSCPRLYSSAEMSATALSDLDEEWVLLRCGHSPQTQTPVWTPDDVRLCCFLEYT